MYLSFLNCELFFNCELGVITSFKFSSGSWKALLVGSLLFLCQIIEVSNVRYESN